MIDDPIATLKQHHRANLDRQAELGIEARQLAARVETITAELTALAATLKLSGAILALMTTATTQHGSTGTTEATDGKPAARRQTR